MNKAKTGSYSGIPNTETYHGRTCLTCNMELHPYKNEDDEVVRPRFYCDELCYRAMREHPEMFREHILSRG